MHFIVRKASCVIGSVNDAEVARGTGLAGMAIIQVAVICQGVAKGAGANEAWLGECSDAGLAQPVFVRSRFPAAKRMPIQS